MAALGDRASTRRLLDRFGFGPRPGDLDAGFDRTATTLLTTTLLAATDTSAAPPAGEDQNALALWWLDRMVTSETPLVERITWFWHGHFATSAQKVRSAPLMATQNQTIRQHGLGDFAVLANAMVVDPAMLIWLDGQKNTAKAANENLGRELMELFTLGVGHYAEEDVRAAARALTGWKVDRATGAVSFAAKQHDGGSKTVLGTTGPLDAHSLVDVLVNNPASPRFVAQRLWQRTVSNAPAPDDVIARLTAAYGGQRDIRSLVRAVVAEPAFRDSANTVVKQPVEWLVGVMRAFGLRPSTMSNSAKLLAGLRGMGQVPFLPPSVGGWPSGGAWLTTSAGLARLQVARLLAAAAKFDKLGSDPVAGVAQLLGVESWSDRTKAALAPLTRQPAQLAAVAVCAPEYVVSA
jgi:uncharacterized protein (DUF1800 family)